MAKPLAPSLTFSMETILAETDKLLWSIKANLPSLDHLLKTVE